MPAKYKVVLFLTFFLFLFLVKPTASYADELIHPPIVESITGPTTGYYGQTYNFTVAASSGGGYTITTLYLQNDGDTFSSRSAGDSGCSGTSCTFTGSFTPPTVGTFVIHAAAAYTNGLDSNTCNSYSADAITDCQNSGSRYITFTVLAAPTTPMVQSITGPTSGIVGGSYTFTSVVTSIESLPIENVVLRAGLAGGSSAVLSTTTPPVGSTCTTTSCIATGIFTPSAVGTYTIFVAPSTGGNSCSTEPGASVPCSYSTGRFITFVVTTDGSGQGIGGDDLPDTGILSNQTKNVFIGLGFICLGILTTQTSKIMNILGLTPEKRRSRFENKFK